MSDTILEKHVELLRRKSRASLARVDENTDRIKAEVERLRLQDWKSFPEHENSDLNPRYEKNTQSWKLRNDSSGVGASLCPDYVYDNPKHKSVSMPEVPSFRKIQLVSKRQLKGESVEHRQRKPVKGCYCNLQFRKTRSLLTKTQREQSSPCVHCKSQFEFRDNNIEKNVGRKILRKKSCENLDKHKNYENKTAFCRNSQVEDCTDSFSFYCNKLPTDCDNKFDHSDSKHINLGNNARRPAFVPEKLNAQDQNCICSQLNKSNKSVEKQAKSKLGTVKKTISSKKLRLDSKNDISQSGTRSTNNIIAPTCTQDTCYHSNKSKAPSNITSCTNRHIHSDSHKGGIYSKNRVDCNKAVLSDEQIEDIKAFREQNYFDTHGSSRLLFSPVSSGSLDQYVLNERLFPERVRSIHKNDLVLTIPPCATTQGKRVHYFPRYIVHQEKDRNANYKKRRCQSCPLTGHAIDFGVLKEQFLVNSLALKYQKRLM